jgi:hypothetical protein
LNPREPPGLGKMANGIIRQPKFPFLDKSKFRRIASTSLFPSIHRHAQLVAHIGAANPEDDVGGDIRGVVGDPLQVRATRMPFIACCVNCGFSSISLSRSRGRGGSCGRSRRPSRAPSRPGARRRPAAPAARADHAPGKLAHGGKIHRQSTSSCFRISLVRRAMPIDWSPIRSRSPLILITARMKRRSMAMGCSLASSS